MRVIFLIALFLISTLNKGFAWEIASLDRGLALEYKVNLVFCPLNYTDKESFLRDIGILLQKLKRTQPFEEFIETIGFWRADIAKAEEEAIFKEAQGFPPLKVRRDFLDDITVRIKADFKLIIIDAGGSVSCAELSSVDKMSLVILGKARYNNSNSFAKGFLHELGHSLGLRDECVDCNPLSPAGPPNCAASKEEAQEWWGDLAGKLPRVNYITGCSGNKNYIRPTIASLMNDADKAEDFGPVNERFLKKELEKR